jgi:hypothetical protein
VLFLFRLIYFCVIILSFGAGALVTASLFIADRAPQSGTFLGISLVVTGFFLVLGILLYGIQHHAAAIALLSLRRKEGTDGSLRHEVDRLLAYLIVGGFILGAILSLANFVILARIDQGFAVFG